MWHWFSRSKGKADGPRSARERTRFARGGDHPHPKQHSGPPSDDPIKNWESADQAFLRQSGDPFG